MKRLCVCIVPFPEVTRGDRFSLGGAYIATALEFETSKNGWPVDIHYLNDLDHCLHSPETIANEILKFNPDVVAFGLFVWSEYVARKVAFLLKEAKKDILVVGGGPWVSGDLVSLAREYEHFDCLIAGDAEFSFCEVVQRFLESRKKEDLKGITGTIVRENDHIEITPRKLVDPNLVPNPYGTRFLAPIGRVLLPIRRGCGMRCKYCNWGGGFSKPLSKENIRFILEYAFLRKLGIWVVDSAIDHRMQDLLSFAKAVEEIEPSGFEPHITAFIDYQNVDRKTCELLKRCGFNELEVGLQSITPEALIRSNRKFEKNRFEEAISLLTDFADVAVDLILGLPGDTPEGFVRTVDYVKSLGVHAHLFLLLGVTSSEFYTQKEKYGLVFDPVQHYLISSPTFSEKDLALCASYFVENYPWKWVGSDFGPANPRFARFAYNYIVPFESYVIAHKKFQEPLPPPRLSPGVKIFDVGAIVKEATKIKSETTIDGFSVVMGGYSYNGCRLEVRENDGAAVGFVTILRTSAIQKEDFLIAGKNLGVRYWTLNPQYESSVCRIAEAVGDALMRWEEKEGSITLIGAPTTVSNPPG